MIMGGLGERFESYCDMLSLAFRLTRTPRAESLLGSQNFVTGKGVVFTGKMQSGTRSEMQTLARRLGAKVQTHVSGATDLLVCGENVGPKKLENARRKGVQILTESEFFSLIGDDSKS
jgi:DNA ligase (NAD+)